MDLQLGTTTRPDGELYCRPDGIGTRVAVLPATCKLGLHALRPAECRAIVDGGEVHIVCPDCDAADTTADGDHCWRLTINGVSPTRAELDDAPYRHLLPRRTRTPAVR